MAKNTPRTNAFGIAPDSFETNKTPLVTEETLETVLPAAPVASPVTPVAPVVPVLPVVPVTPTAEASATVQKKKIYPMKERNTVRVHFRAKQSMIDRVDAFSDASGLNRTEIIEAALTMFLDKMEE